MRRRQVLTGAAGVLGMLALPGRCLAHRETPFAERSFRNRSGDAASPGIASLWCRVELHSTEARASAAFEKHYADATSFEDEAFGEISYSEITEYDLPPDMIELPHRFATYATIAGAAAFEADHAVGVVRRETIGWVYVAQGHGASEVADTIARIAASMAEREIGEDEITIDELGQHHGALWDLLPALDDVPAELILEADASPDGQFNAQGTPIPPTPDW